MGEIVWGNSIGEMIWHNYYRVNNTGHTVWGYVFYWELFLFK